MRLLFEVASQVDYFVENVISTKHWQCTFICVVIYANP